jgi:hypothetical protein
MSIESQIKVLETVVSRIDFSIEKLTEVSNNISKLLAVHDERINTLEKTNERSLDDIKELHSRITTVSREICEKIDQIEQTVELRLKQSSVASTEQHNKIQEDIEGQIEKMSDRISALEKWRWVLLGAGITIGFITGNFSSLKLVL